MRKAIKKHPRRTIVIGFMGIILIGTLLLMLPISSESGQSVPFVDSLFTSTSAVCVTGLVVVDPGDTFTVFGETVIALLIQIGGLGITSIGVITILIASGKVSMGGRKLAKEAFNLATGKGLRDVILGVVYVTLAFELLGAALSFITFIQDYALKDAVGISFFHSIAAFNNAGFDIFGGFKNMADYRDDVWINLVTSMLIIMGGIGFFVTREMFAKRSFKQLSLHSKVVISMTGALIVVGTVLLKLSEGTTWLSAFFHSVSARTAGFASEPMGDFSTVGVLIMVFLMFVGASPGSTGGGIKTTTFFVILNNMRSVAFNRHCTAFRRKIPAGIVSKALVVAMLAMASIFISTTLLCIFEPGLALEDVVFEVVSGFGTVGLSRGITPNLSTASEIVLVFTMFIGRLGPLTIITLWWNNAKPQASYSEEELTVG
ncbi:MAG: potassium transporter TrkG [Anaerovoracaceae bacterium]